MGIVEIMKSFFGKCGDSASFIKFNMIREIYVGKRQLVLFLTALKKNSVFMKADPVDELAPFPG
jgi:hypothetical protein